MRLTLAFAVAAVVAACGLQQTGSSRIFDRSGSRASQATLDADAILHGMAQARQSNERVARETGRDGARAASPALAR